MRALVVGLLLVAAAASTSFAQFRVPARQVEPETNSFTTLTPTVNTSIYPSVTIPTNSMQAYMEGLDDLLTVYQMDTAGTFVITGPLTLTTNTPTEGQLIRYSAASGQWYADDFLDTTHTNRDMSLMTNWAGVVADGGLNLNSNTLTAVKYAEFDLSYTNGTAEGRLQWNTDDGTLEVGLPGGNVNLQIGQEHLIRARNTTGSTISNGQAVAIVGAQGNRPLIALADADAGAPTNNFAGLATEDIADSANGYVTMAGLVRDLDTSAYTEGTLLYLSTTPGAVTNVEPSAPTDAVVVGTVVRSHASTGSILVEHHDHKGWAELDARYGLLTVQNALATTQASHTASISSLEASTNALQANKIDVLSGTGTNLTLGGLSGAPTTITVSGAGSTRYNGTYADSGSDKNGQNIYVYNTTNFLFFVTIPQDSWCLDGDTNITKRQDADYWHASQIAGMYIVEDGVAPAPAVTADGIGPALTLTANMDVQGNADIDGDLQVGSMSISDSTGIPVMTIQETASNAVFSIYVNDKGRLSIAKQGAGLGTQTHRSLAVGANQDSLSTEDSVQLANFTGVSTNHIDFSTSGTGADVWIEDNLQVGGIQNGTGGGGILVGTNGGASVYITNGNVTASATITAEQITSTDDITASGDLFCGNGFGQFTVSKLLGFSGTAFDMGNSQGDINIGTDSGGTLNLGFLGTGYAFTSGLIRAYADLDLNGNNVTNVGNLTVTNDVDVSGWVQSGDRFRLSDPSQYYNGWQVSGGHGTTFDVINTTAGGKVTIGANNGVLQLGRTHWNSFTSTVVEIYDESGLAVSVTNGTMDLNGNNVTNVGSLTVTNRITAERELRIGTEPFVGSFQAGQFAGDAGQFWIYNTFASGDMRFGTLGTPIHLGNLSWGSYTSSAVLVYDSTGLNTTFTNGTMDLNGNNVTNVANLTVTNDVNVSGDTDVTGYLYAGGQIRSESTISARQGGNVRVSLQTSSSDGQILIRNNITELRAELNADENSYLLDGLSIGTNATTATFAVSDSGADVLAVYPAAITSSVPLTVEGLLDAGDITNSQSITFWDGQGFSGQFTNGYLYTYAGLYAATFGSAVAKHSLATSGSDALYEGRRVDNVVGYSFYADTTADSYIRYSPFAVGTNALAGQRFLVSDSGADVLAVYTAAITSSVPLTVKGLSSTTATIPLNIQATNNATASDRIFQVGDSADSALLYVRGDQRVVQGNSAWAPNFLTLQSAGTDCRVVNSYLGAAFDISARDGALALGIDRADGYDSALVQIWENGSLNTTFTNGDVIAVGDITANAFIGDGSALTGISGGGSITTKTVRIFADAQSQMFGGDTQPSTFIATNAGLSTTHVMAFFEAEKRQHFGASRVFVPLNANSNVILRFPYYSTTTNLTFAPYVWYSDGATAMSVTGTTTTIPACDLTNQASYAETLTLTGLTAGAWFWISGGIADTNTTGTSYTDDINVDTIEFDILAE